MKKIIISSETGRIFVLTAVMAAVCGCGIYGNYRTPEYSIAENAYGDVPFSDSTSAGDISWRNFFSDENLINLIDTALVNNSDMISAAMNIEEAIASLKSARLAYLPSFSASPSAGFSSGGTDIRLPIEASWEIDLSGSIRNAKKSQIAVLKSSLAYRQTVQSALVATLATQYYTLLALEAQKEIYIQTEQAWKETVEMTRHLMESGRYNAVSLFQARSDYYSIRNSLSDVYQQIRQTENQICSLAGMVSGTHIPRGKLSGWSAPECLSTGIPVKVLSSRPDVRQAEAELEQAFYNINIARSAMYPSLTITGSLDFGTILADALASLVQPIFQRGKLRAELKIAKARMETAEATFRQTLTDAGIEVNNAVSEINTAREKSDNYTQQILNLESAVEGTRLLMQNGSTTYLEVLTAQEALLDARIGQISNTLNSITSTISLYKALGGGCPDWQEICAIETR